MTKDKQQSTITQRPKVGLGVYIRKDGKILIGKRRGAHSAGTWAPPGGHVEWFESWEECAKREVEEEVGLKIKNIRFMTATNDLMPSDDKHYITIHMVADWKAGEVQNLEPEKCEQWEWFSWEKLPRPLAVFFRNMRKQGYNPIMY